MLDTGIQAGIAPVTTAPGVDGTLVEAYTLYSEPVRRWLAARTRDDDLAEELTHEAFIRLMGELRRGTQIENPKAWLFHAAGNLLMSHYRHAQVAGRHVPEGPAFDTASAEAVVLAQEQMEHLHRVLVRLPAEDRRLLVAAGQGEDGPRSGRAGGHQPGRAASETVPGTSPPA